jgi:hypothetical protein
VTLQQGVATPWYLDVNKFIQTELANEESSKKNRIPDLLTIKNNDEKITA